MRDDFTPFELYIKMLIEYFGKRVEYDPYNIDLLLPEKYMRLKYQSDAAKSRLCYYDETQWFYLG
ncbi:MAG: hypothetical protein KatS3mg035_0225 [Bacteroidia bacterium]|nr:MAG: hypothetical protein KatS3mg035_0225 [Bacteroidia bacterium]